MLFRTSVCLATITVSVILQELGNLATFGYSYVENNELFFLNFGPFCLDRNAVSRSLVTKLTTIQVKLHVE